MSGESIAGRNDSGISSEILSCYSSEIAQVVKAGTQVAVVVGGGNIFRGLEGIGKGFDRVRGDSMGMLATVINSIAVQCALESAGLKAVVLTSIRMEPVGEYYSSAKAIKYLEEGYVTIIAGGTGNPYFTTDSAAALRGIELKADILLKGTRVNGVYTADPEKDPNALKYDSLSFDEAYGKGLKIMDLTAFSLCRENALPIIVFNINMAGNLRKAVSGELVGTIIE
jgi:uridylate kinase